MPQDPAERRVVVTGAPRRARRSSGYYRPRTEIDEQTTLGHTYVRSLMRSQLRVALAVFLVLVLLVAPLPLVFARTPGPRRNRMGRPRIRPLRRRWCCSPAGTCAAPSATSGTSCGSSKTADRRLNQNYAVPAVALVVLATVLVGAFGLRVSRTTSDFYVASRTVGPRLNAAAISGEYLSAASFLGIAGLVLVQGPDMLWYPVGYTAGYLVLLLFVAAPLRRSGAYTLPDFAEARLGSQAVRRLAGAFVVGVGWLYLLPQLQGAGLTLAVTDRRARLVRRSPRRGRRGRHRRRRRHAQHHLRPGLPVLAQAHRPARPRALPASSPGRRDGAPRHAFDEPATFREQRVVRIDDSLDLKLARPAHRHRDRHRRRPPHQGERLRLPAGTHRVERGTRLTFAQGDPVPAAGPRQQRRHVDPARGRTARNARCTPPTD